MEVLLSDTLTSLMLEISLSSGKTRCPWVYSWELSLCLLNRLWLSVRQYPQALRSRQTIIPGT